MTKLSYDKDDPATIQKMFGTIAKNYDRTNAILSFNLHKRWNRTLLQILHQQQPNISSLADLCCGTGAIGLKALDVIPSLTSLTLIDFCQEMLDCAQERSFSVPATKTIQYIQADVQFLPLGNASISAATMAYGIRNVKDPLKCFHEVHRVLKPGGTFAFLELTRPSNSFLRMGHKVYLSVLLPLLGRAFASNQEAYEYLSSSINRFLDMESLCAMLKTAGFEKTSQHTLMNGIATVVTATKIHV